MAAPMVHASSLGECLACVVEDGNVASEVVIQLVDNQEDIVLTHQSTGRDPDGRMLFYGGHDGLKPLSDLYFYSPDTGKWAQVLRGPGRAPRSPLKAVVWSGCTLERGTGTGVRLTAMWRAAGSWQHKPKP